MYLPCLLLRDVAVTVTYPPSPQHSAPRPAPRSPPHVNKYGGKIKQNKVDLKVVLLLRGSLGGRVSHPEAAGVRWGKGACGDT